MRFAGTKSTKKRVHASCPAPRLGSTKLRFGSTKLAATAVRGALTLAVFSALLIAARPAQAQTETVLYNFSAGPSYGGPTGSLTFHRGNLYGTTTWLGQQSVGSVFQLSPNGLGGWNETTLYSFTGNADGGYPLFSHVIFDRTGNIYGTASSGGATGNGVVFELSSVGGSWKETVLYSFTGGTYNYSPVNGLIMDGAGNLYGTTANFNGGEVFELIPSSGGWTEKVLNSFSSYINGPRSGLAMNAAGNIFGVGELPDHDSTVFELSRNAIGGWKKTVLYAFTQAQGALSINSTLALDQSGNLYGTSGSGGNQNSGTVFELSPAKNGPWTYTLLYSFSGLQDGGLPFGGVTFDAAGNIYGSTETGGLNGYGTVFELTPAGNGTYTEKVLWSFNSTDGATSLSGVILDSAGNLYGTARDGGANNEGVVFEVTP